MASWDEFVEEFTALEEEQRSDWLVGRLLANLQAIAALRNRNVLLYGSAWLQKPAAPGPFVAVAGEDINGIMTALHGMDCSRGLTLILHTPGGEIGAAQTIGEYLHSKFDDIECIVPTYAMSAGTMLALGCNNIVMGRQSQLGPIDAQLSQAGQQISAGAVRAQFEQAATEIIADPRRAHIWAPLLQSLGPSLLQEAQYGLDYGQSFVMEWLENRMFRGQATAKAQAETVAAYFNATSNHKFHGRRINRDEARQQGLSIEDLEVDQALQEAVLSAYHIMTIMFETSPSVKMIVTDAGRNWIKNFA